MEFKRKILMIQSQTLIQFCIQQDRLIASLNELHQMLTQFYDSRKRNSSLRWEKVSHQLADFEAQLSQEIDRLIQLVENSALAQLSIRPHLEEIVGRLRDFSQNLTLKYREVSLEDLGARFSALADSAVKLRDDVKGIDLKGALFHVADAVLVENYDALAEQKDIQWARKCWHMIAGLSIVAIYLFSKGSFFAKMTIFGSFTAFASLSDAFRLIFPKMNAMVFRDLQKFMRKNEVSRLNSMTFYALSTFFVCLAFPKGIAILSVLYLAIGDMLASIIGVKWGRHKIGHGKSLEGSLAFFFSCFLITFLYPIVVPSFQGSIWVLAFLGGFIGMLSEIALPRLDDNFVIPIFSAIFLSLAVWII